MTSKNIQIISGNLLFIMTCILAVSLPFAFIDPVLVIPPIDFSNIEIIILLSAAAGTGHLIALWRTGELKTILQSYHSLLPVILTVVAFLITAGLSALFAPDYKVSAFRFSFRYIIGAYIFALTILTARTPGKVHILMWALAVGAGISALLGIGEALPWSDIDRALLLFKTAPSKVGGILRVSATFQYTTIASMYFEMAVPVALALAALSQKLVSRLLAFAIAAVCIVAIVLTLTRSGMAALLILNVLLVLLAGWRYRRLLIPAIAAMAVLILTVGVMLADESSFSTRLTTESDTDWYGAVYNPPPELVMESGQTTPVNVEVTNTGKIKWRSAGENAYYLGYYWYNVDKKAFVAQAHVEAPLPHDVSPGETVTLDLQIQPFLPPGRYNLIWGMLQSNVLWFRHRDVPEASTAVEVTRKTSNTTNTDNSGVSLIPPGGDKPQGGPAAISRSDLWRVALQMWREHPLTGVGADNYRLLYGKYLGFTTWYEGNHSNNLYLELLATMGLLGFGAFLAVLGVLLVYLWRIMQKHPYNLIVPGLGGVLLMFLMHGMFDYFLPWIPTLGFFWMITGLIAVSYLHTTSASAPDSSLNHTVSLSDDIPAG